MKTKKSSKKKREKSSIKLTVRQKKILAIVVAILLVFILVYARPIIKLRAENRALKQQNEELQEERNATAKELKNVHSKDYIQEQARRQLRLLDKDEKMFIFDDGKDDEDKN